MPTKSNLTTSNTYILAEMNYSETATTWGVSSKVNVAYYLWRTNSILPDATKGTGTFTVTCNGSSQSENRYFTVPEGYSNKALAVSKDFTINHGFGVSKSVNCSASGVIPSTTLTSFNLPTYSLSLTYFPPQEPANVTSASVSSVGFTTANIYITTDIDMDKIDYNGTQISAGGQSESFTIYNLSPATSYNYTIKARSSASGLWGTSKSVSFTTKTAATVTALSDFVIGSNSIPISINNPSAGYVRFRMHMYSSANPTWTEVASVNAGVVGSSYSFIFTQAQKDAITAKMSTSLNAQYKVYCDSFPDSNYTNGTTTDSGIIKNITLQISTISLSPPIFEIGTSTVILNVTRYIPTLKHRITYSFNGSPEVLIYPTDGSLAGDLLIHERHPALADLAPLLTNDTIGNGVMYIYSYSGTDLAGRTEATFIASIPTSVVPSFTSITASELNSMVATKFGLFAQKLSNIRLNVNGAQGIYGSTISNYAITYNGVTYNLPQYDTGTISWSGDNLITATITDTRGRTATKEITINAVPYDFPIVDQFKIERCNSDGTVNALGEYAKIIRVGYSTSLMNVTERNTIEAHVFSKERNSPTYTEITGAAVSKSSDLTGAVVYDPNNLIVHSPYITDSSYDFKLELSDEFNTTTKLFVLSTGYVIMSVCEDGVGIGKIWESGTINPKLDVGGNFNVVGSGQFSGDLSIGGALTIQNSGSLNILGSLSVAETTLVDNLNAEYLNGFSADRFLQKSINPNINSYFYNFVSLAKTISTTNGSPDVIVTDPTEILVGMIVTGHPNIPNGTRIISINGNILTLESNAGATTTGISVTISSPSPTGTSHLMYSGYFEATRVYNAVFNDYAEFFLKDEELNYGDVISKNPNGDGYIKSTKEYDNNVVGVYSDSYAQCIGGESGLSIPEVEQKYASIGLAGRCSVKVTGNIELGDLLVSSSIPGVAMATKNYVPGTIIGKALEAHNNVGIGKIKMFILNN